MKIHIKKLCVISLILSSVFLAWCGKTWQDMSFDDTYKTLKSHNIFAGREYTTPDLTKILNDTTYINFGLRTAQWFSATWVITSKWTYNFPSPSWWAIMNVYVDAVAFEPSFWTSLNLSGWLQFIENSKQVFWIINFFKISPERAEWNVEWWVLSALVNTISNKWIQLTTPWDEWTIVPYRKNMIEFLHQFNIWWNKYNLFKEVWKTSIDGYSAYKIWWDEAGVREFVQHILQDAKNIGTPVTFDGATMDEVINGIVSSPLEWYMIIKSSNHIVLRIDSIATADSWNLGFEYDKNWMTLSIKDTTNTSIGKGTVTVEKNELRFGLSVPSSKTEITWETKNNQQIVIVNIVNPQINLTLSIEGKTWIADSYTPLDPIWAIPISQIIAWFNMIWEGAIEEQSTVSVE